MRYYISIEKNIDDFELFRALWNKHSINGIRAENMSNGIKKAIEIEKSETDELFFIEIVADSVDYMSQLKIINEETNAPILIATSNYNEDEHLRALNLGADFYGAFCKTPEQNINAVLATICSIERRAKKKKQPTNIIFYNGIMLVPSYRNTIFINDIELELTKIDFDLLHYFMSNRGIVLSTEQIYNHVWGNERAVSVDDVVRSAIKRLRKKINPHSTDCSIIENIREIGYRLPIKFEK